MEILTWNIQCGRGVDGRVDLDRIARTVRGAGDAAVVCFQEVARHDPELDGGAGEDQPAALAARFPGYEPVYGVALDRGGGRGGRRQLGNLVLARVPVLAACRHLLPRPPDGAVQHMWRQATEVVVAAPWGALRITTVHLEYHSARQRDAQVERLRALHAEGHANRSAPPVDPGSGPYAGAPWPRSAVICGDFNFDAADAQHARMTAPFADGTPALSDAWLHLHGGRPRDPTCGVFDRAQWPQGPHCRDYFFVTDDVLERVRAVAVDTETDASDHQPVRLTLTR